MGAIAERAFACRGLLLQCISSSSRRQHMDNHSSSHPSMAHRSSRAPRPMATRSSRLPRSSTGPQPLLTFNLVWSPSRQWLHLFNDLKHNCIWLPCLACVNGVNSVLQAEGRSLTAVHDPCRPRWSAPSPAATAAAASAVPASCATGAPATAVPACSRGSSPPVSTAIAAAGPTTGWLPALLS